MNKWQSLATKTIKAALWVVVIVMLCLLLIAGLIQIPSIQNKIVQYATTFISKKTHTRVELKNIRISFPKSIIINGLYLEDQKKDTLIYAGKAKLNIALYSLFVNKISISSFTLEDATVKLYSTQTTPQFNYNFLFSAFSDTTQQVKTDKQSKWTFSLDRVYLKNVRFSYRDEYAGMNVVATLEKSDFTMKELNPEKSIYNINELFLEGLSTSILIKKSTNTSKNQSESILPKIAAKHLHLGKSQLAYVDSTSNRSVKLLLDQCELEDASIDLQTQLLSSAYIDLSKSKLDYHTFATELPSATTTIDTGNNWKITLNHIDLEDNTFSYQSGNKIQSGKEFGAKFQQYNHLMLKANDFLYSPDQIYVSILKFSTTDQNNFAITRLETDFSMNQHSITAKRLKIETPYSTLDADFNLNYSSLTTLMDSMRFNMMNLDLRAISICNSDILYFKSGLAQQTFFKNSLNHTTASGKISGSMNDLTGQNLTIKTGTHTIVETDFNITGLPKFKTAMFDFPNLEISTGKKDLEMLASSFLPKSIELPDSISLQIAFKGKLKSFESTASMSSSFGKANLSATVDSDENFSGKLNLENLDLGRLLKNTALYGPVSLTTEASGKGLDLKTLKANLKAEATQLQLNQYTYHNLKVDGTVTGKEFDGKISLNDENAIFDFDGLVNLNPTQEHFQFRLNVKGADLQKLHLTNDDVRIGLVASADFSGSEAEMKGNASISELRIVHQEKAYSLDKFLAASVNEPKNDKLDVSKALIGINYTGTVSSINLSATLNPFLNNYFPLSDTIQKTAISESSKFSFEVLLHNHPIISEVLFPQLKEFEPGIIQGSFDSKKNDLKLNVTVPKMVYGTTKINNFRIAMISDNTALNYKISSSAISDAQVKLDNFLFEGKLGNNKLFADISSIDNKKNKKLQIKAQLVKDQTNYKLSLDPTEFFLMNNQWNIAADNYIEFGKQGFLIHHLFMNQAETRINIASSRDQFNDDLNISIQNFKLDDLSGIVEKDTSLIKGTLNGTLELKRVNNAYGLIADATVKNLTVKDVPLGNLTVKAENISSEKFSLDLNLSGTDNNLTAKGYFIPNGGENSINVNTDIQSLSLKTVEVFSMGQLKESSGTLSGNLRIEGSPNAPELSGELIFNNAFIKPAFLNNRLELKHEILQLQHDGIYFKSFTLLDPSQHTATIDGSIQMKQFSDFKFDLQINAKDFLLFNTTAKDNKEFYGRMVIDSKIEVNGPMKLPVVNGRVKMKKGSNFTFSVPEDRLTTDKGEDVVEFENKIQLNPILNRTIKKEKQKSGITGLDLKSIIEIDKQATLRLLMDPASTDSLVVKGEAALSFTMDQSGKMSLTGAYNLTEGNYLISLESVIKKKFSINAGSTISWNGDPMDAEISIDASYLVRTSPYDLVVGQLSGLSDVDQGGYKQRYPFLIMLKLRGKILKPEISFEIQLPPEDKGILGGAVTQKLNLLNEDESALNKQVFALLVLGRFVQENPFQTESTDGTSTLIRSTVGKFLSAQLNQLSSKVLPGMELNFDIQSYNDYQTGQAQGRTQVEIGVKKQLFNERLSVQLGGSVDVEGDQAKQNSASEITGDVTVEYKLTKDGRFRMKGFRHNQYEGAIEGQLVETGAGVVYVRDFNRWRRLFKTGKGKIAHAPKQGELKAK